MHIARVSIKHYRNFRQIDVDDLPPAVVLVGENGSGKSNFLEALRLVLDPSLSEVSRQLSGDDFWDGLPRPFAGSEIEVIVELAGFDEDRVAKSVLGEFLVATGPHRARLTYLYRPSSNTEDVEASSESDYEAIVYGGVDENMRIGRAEWRFISMRVLEALRDAQTSLRSARSPLRRLIARSEVSSATVEQVVAQIDTAAASLTESDELSAVANAVSSRLSSMVGDLFAVPTSLGVVSANPEQLLRSLRLFVDAERRRGVEQASLGTTNLLYLTLLLEDIAAQREAEEIVELILAVEEPEAHLHPHVQRVLFRHLLASDRALLVTTHSPHIASVTPLESLLLLRERDAASEAFRIDTSVIGANHVADLERYLDVTRAEVLFARTIVLVEGLAELYLLPAFASDAGLDLDSHGVTVCSVHGADFAPYVRLLGEDGLDIPHIVLTDGDPDKNGKPVGVARARRLLVEDSATELDAAIEDEDWSEARRLCAEAGVMVGGHTLEIDLVETAADAMVHAFEDLVETPLRRKRFRAAVEGAADDPELAKKVVARIEAIGKGRYAQRLASHLGGVAPPAHIAAALERLAEIVAAPAAAEDE